MIIVIFGEDDIVVIYIYTYILSLFLLKIHTDKFTGECYNA